MPLVPVRTTAVLTAAMIVKRDGADFALQTDGMARGKERAQGWLAPLVAYAGCHATITPGVALAVAPRLWWLAGVDRAAHVSMDRAEAVLGRRGGWTIVDVRFRWLPGFDQMPHEPTNPGLVAALLSLQRRPDRIM